MPKTLPLLLVVVAAHVALQGNVLFAKAKKSSNKNEASPAVDTPAILNDDGSVRCPSSPPKVPEWPRSDTYTATPYKAGERAEFEVRYFNALVGMATMEVRPPTRTSLGAGQPSVWHRNFHVDGATGDWYKYIFVAHDRVDATVRPWDHAVTKFYIEQDEGKMFGRRFQQKKWLDFDHVGCQAQERTERVGRAEKKASFPLQHGAMDTLGVAYWMREQTFVVGTPVRTLVYSSEKNWWLEAMPLAVEDVSVKAGKFSATKLKLQTFFGKELQQKGDVLVWISTQGERPIIQVKADIKLGSIWIELAKFQAGKS